MCAQPSGEHHGELVEVAHVQGSFVGRGALERGLQEAVEGEVGGEGGGEKAGEGAVEGVLHTGLAEDADLARGAEGLVLGDFEGVADLDIAVAVFLLDHADAGVGVEAGVADGEDEAAVWFEDSGKGLEEGGDFDHVEQGHIAHGGVEGRVRQRGELGGVGSVQLLELDLGGGGGDLLAGGVDHLGAHVGGEDACAEFDQATGEEACAAGDLQDALAGFDLQQALGRRRDEFPVEGVALLAHMRVPERGVGVPDLADVAVSDLFHKCDFVVIKDSAPNATGAVRRRSGG